MKNDILVLIASYVNAVRRAVAVPQVHLHTTALLEAVRKDRQRREGSIDSITTYAFHGVGCRVTTGETTVDFDFGPDGMVGGFDAWRLWLFADGNPGRFSQWKNRDQVEEALQRIQAEGLIALPRAEPSPHLYYPTREGEKAIGEVEEAN